MGGVNTSWLAAYSPASCGGGCRVPFRMSQIGPGPFIGEVEREDVAALRSPTWAPFASECESDCEFDGPGTGKRSRAATRSEECDARSVSSIYRTVTSNTKTTLTLFQW